jgi:hypothetical protein
LDSKILMVLVNLKNRGLSEDKLKNL